MSGQQNFRRLQARIEADPVRRARLESERQLTKAIVELTALRRARGVTKQQIADAWAVTQANISQIEHSPDILLSTLRDYVGALGGRLEISAVFPDQRITLSPADGLDNPERRLALRSR